MIKDIIKFISSIILSLIGVVSLIVFDLLLVWMDIIALFAMLNFFYAYTKAGDIYCRITKKERHYE